MYATTTTNPRYNPTMMNTEAGTIEVRRATKADIPALARVLGRAFDADPFVNWLVQQDAKRTDRIERLFQICLASLSNRLEETYTTPDLRGVALWKKPGAWRTSSLAELPLIPAYAQVTGWSGLGRLTSSFDFMRTKHEHYVPEPHYYLSVLGVDPAHQRQGIGSRLLAPVLQKCDTEGRPAYLETVTERDVAYYAKFGFTVCEHVDKPPCDRPPAWLMRREPHR